MAKLTNFEFGIGVTGLVIDNAGEFRRLYFRATINFNHAIYIAASPTGDITLLTVPPRTRIVSFMADTTIAWAGLGGTISLIAGKSVGGAEYIATHDVKSAAVTKGLADADMGTSLTRAAAIQGGDIPSWTVATNITCRITSGTGNIGNGTVTSLNAGQTTFVIGVEVMP